MGNEGLFHLEPEPTEDQGPRIGSGGALGIEVDLFPSEIVQGPDFRSNEDMQFGWKQVEHIGNLPLDVRYLALVLFECVGIDDCRIDTAQIEQRVDVLGCTAG